MGERIRLSPSGPAIMARYKSSVLRLTGLVRGLAPDPWAVPEQCLHAQMKLLQKIIYVEGRIRATRKQTESIKATLARRAVSISSRPDARSGKKVLADLRARLDGYRRILHILRDIGDAIAFTYMDRYDIKPMRFKQEPGFVSGKRGLRRELFQLRRVFVLGGIGILNDLTHCLRYGDIAAGYGGAMLAICEVKSGRRPDRRSTRQSAALTKIVDYLRTDLTHDLYGRSGEFRRITARGERRNHIDRLNELMRKAKTNGWSWEQVERGLFYVVLYENDLDWMEAIGKNCTGRPMISIVNELTWKNAAYFPFVLSFHDPESLWDFYAGRMLVAIVVDTEVLVGHFAAKGLNCELLDDNDLTLRVQPLDTHHDWEARFSRPSFCRLFAEFRSLEGLCHEFSAMLETENQSER